MKRDISLYILLLSGHIIALLTGCQKEHSVTESNKTITLQSDSVTTTISIFTEPVIKTGADENITNATLLLFSENDTLSASYFIDKNENITIKTTAGYKTIVAVANAGNITPEAGTALADFKQTRLRGITEESNQLIYSGEYRGHLNSNHNRVNIPLQSVMAKVSVIFDHSNLYHDVSIEITKVQLKNVPVNTSIFTPNRPDSAEEIIEEGEYITTNTNPAQHETATPLYLPENLQGNTLSDMCSYVEINALYNSSTKTGEVKYRSYFGEGGSYDIVRGVHYKNRIIFSGTGIGENSWRNETSGLTDVKPPFIYISYLSITPYNINLTSIGEQFTFNAYIVPLNASDKNIIWIIGNPSVATVSNRGVVTAVGAGETNLKIAANDGSGISSDYVKIVVDPYIPVTSAEVVLSESTLNGIGLNTTATAIINPNNATNKAVVWSSSDSSVATVSQDGVVISHGSGICSIIATSAENSHISGEATLEVVTETPVQDIQLYPGVITIDAGNQIQIQATVYPTNATNKTILWSSDNNSVATISSEGVLCALMPGSCFITAGSTDGSAVSASVQVTVTEPYIPVGGITLSTNYLAMISGESRQIEAHIEPSNASNQEVEWHSSNPSVATVCPSGGVTGVSSGTTLITATSSNGQYSAVCTVDIFQPLGIYVSIHEYFNYNPFDGSINSAEVILFARLGLDVPSDMNIVYSVISNVYVNISYSYIVKGSVVNASSTLTLDGANNNDYPWISIGGSTATISLSSPLSEQEIIDAIASLSITIHPGSIFAGHYYITW